MHWLLKLTDFLSEKKLSKYWEYQINLTPKPEMNMSTQLSTGLLIPSLTKEPWDSHHLLLFGKTQALPSRSLVSVEADQEAIHCNQVIRAKWKSVCWWLGTEEYQLSLGRKGR